MIPQAATSSTSSTTVPSSIHRAAGSRGVGDADAGDLGGGSVPGGASASSANAGAAASAGAGAGAAAGIGGAGLRLILPMVLFFARKNSTRVMRPSPEVSTAAKTSATVLSPMALSTLWSTWRSSSRSSEPPPSVSARANAVTIIDSSVRLKKASTGVSVRAAAAELVRPAELPPAAALAADAHPARVAAIAADPAEETALDAAEPTDDTATAAEVAGAAILAANALAVATAPIASPEALADVRPGPRSVR